MLLKKYWPGLLAVAIVLSHAVSHPELGSERFYQPKDFFNPYSHEFYVNLLIHAQAIALLS